MSWFRVDDGFTDHPKVIALRAGKHWKGALALWALAGSHCSKHLTDGFVSAAVLSHLGGTTQEADALVAVNLWTRVDGGYQFHEWDERNPTKAKVLAARAADAARKRKGGNDGFQAESKRIPTGVPSDAVPPSASPVPSRPVPSHPEEREPALSLAFSRGRMLSGDVVDGVPLRDFVRSGVIKGYEHLKLPEPRETRDLTWRGWHELEHWTVKKASLLGWDQRETARHLIRCFLRSATARKKGHPIKFLVENANEYWRDELPAEVA